MEKTVAAKMGVKPGTRALLVDGPSSSIHAMRLPELEMSDDTDGEFDYIHLFTITQEDLDTRFPVLMKQLAPKGMFWVSWPKGRKLGSDLSMPEVIRIGYSHGLVESVCLSIDQTWSGLKFTHPKPGKSYHNSFGRLPDADSRGTG